MAAINALTDINDERVLSLLKNLTSDEKAFVRSAAQSTISTTQIWSELTKNN